MTSLYCDSVEQLREILLGECGCPECRMSNKARSANVQPSAAGGCFRFKAGRAQHAY
jgi:hypothetical protein